MASCKHEGDAWAPKLQIQLGGARNSNGLTAVQVQLHRFVMTLLANVVSNVHLVECREVPLASQVERSSAVAAIFARDGEKPIP